MAQVNEGGGSLVYTAKCERAGRWWEITVPELDEVTQARTLDEVPATVADLVALTTDTDPTKVTVNVMASSGPGRSLGRAGLIALTALGVATVVVRRVIRALSRVPAR
jgi:hypothetical protein